MTETLLAVGTLAIGMTFISGTFLTGVFFSTLSTERTIAAVAADEAFAKIRLSGLDPNSGPLKADGCVLYRPWAGVPADDEHLYPSTRLEPQRQYSWSALCRRLNAGSPLVQCTVFVSRQTAGATYWVRQGTGGTPLGTAGLPQPVCVNIAQDAALAQSAPDVVSLKDAVASDGVDELGFVVDGTVLVDDATGQVYRVLERFGTPSADKVRLDRSWVGGAINSAAGGWAWVVPASVSGGRNPLVVVYQDVLRWPGN